MVATTTPTTRAPTGATSAASPAHRPTRTACSRSTPSSPARSPASAARHRRRTSRCRSSPAACSTASSRASTSPTRATSTPPTRCSEACPMPGAPPCSPRPTATATASTCGCRERMRRSSSPSEPSAASGGGLFRRVLARGRVAGEVSDRAWLRAMLDVEAALARAQARAGLLSAADADAIAAAAADTDRFDADAIGAAAANSGNPVVPLVKALTDAVDGPAAGRVHKGATSQDVLDSAAMLVAHRALGPLLEDLDAAADAAAALAEEHAGTVMAGRTLLQQALPVTFGLTAATWLTGLDEAAGRLDEVRRTRLAVQFGGAAGTLASMGDAGPEVLAHLADELGLAEPVLAWHTIRTRPAELAGALGAAAGVIAKACRDVVLLAQTEVVEVREGVP